VVEDAYAGIDAAKAGGMLAAAIGDATSYDKADFILNSFSDLLKF
jgi:beta-phosphoglucomutase